MQKKKKNLDRAAKLFCIYGSNMSPNSGGKKSFCIIFDSSIF